MNLCVTARAFHRQFIVSAFAAIAIVMTFVPGLVPAQTPSRRAGEASRPASSDAAISQLSEAASLLQQGRPGDAEPILRQVLLAAPRNPDAHNLLGIVPE